MGSHHLSWIRTEVFSGWGRPKESSWQIKPCVSYQTWGTLSLVTMYLNGKNILHNKIISSSDNAKLREKTTVQIKCLSLISSAPCCFLLKFSFSYALLNCNFFFPFPAGPHEDSAPFKLRKHSLFYSCQLSGAHMETRKLRQLLPQSVCPWPEVAALSGSLESATLPDGLWFTPQDRCILKLAPACADIPGWELEIQDIKICVPSSHSCCRSSSLERSRAGIARC